MSIVDRGKAVRDELHDSQALVRRIIAEFDDMPGLALTMRQASRFLGVDQTACARILDTLTRDGVLRCTAHDVYVRADHRVRRVS
jgi:DNA-binding Lrp family transcriptional regulator